MEPKRTYPAAYLVRLPRSSRSLYIASYSFFRSLYKIAPEVKTGSDILQTYHRKSWSEVAFYKHNTRSQDRKWHSIHTEQESRLEVTFYMHRTGSQDWKWHSTYTQLEVKIRSDILQTQNRSQDWKGHSTYTESEVKIGSDIPQPHNWKSRLEVTFYTHRTGSQEPEVKIGSDILQTHNWKSR